jgi:hypothetical protein
MEVVVKPESDFAFHQTGGQNFDSSTQLFYLIALSLVNDRTHYECYQLYCNNTLRQSIDKMSKGTATENSHNAGISLRNIVSSIINFNTPRMSVNNASHEAIIVTFVHLASIHSPHDELFMCNLISPIMSAGNH